MSFRYLLVKLVAGFDLGAQALAHHFTILTVDFVLFLLDDSGTS